MSALSDTLIALAEHADVIEVLLRALSGGATKEDVTKAIAATMVATSDAAMREELEQP